MSDYRITSADFCATGESLEPDAVMAPEDLAAIKRQVGGISGFLQAQIASRMAGEIEVPETNTIIIRENK